MNDSRYAKYLYHHNREATRCVNLGAAIREAHSSSVPSRKHKHSTEPRTSATCAKNKHANCFKLDCTCFCHKGGTK